MNSPTRQTFQLVSFISAAHLGFELFVREAAPLAPYGNFIMAGLSALAFLRAELVSIESLATGKNALQRALGLATYIAMMLANGFVQTAYYARSDTALLHEALGWWIVLVGVGVAAQFAAESAGAHTQDIESAQIARLERERNADAAREERLALAKLEAQKEVAIARAQGVHPTVQPNVQLNAPQPAERSERSKPELLNELLNYLSEHPNATYSQIEKVIGRSKGSISGYVSELTESGHLAKNGNGWEVTR